MMKWALVLIIGWLSNINGQSIINTESMMQEIDSTFSFKINSEADLNFGNIDLLQINNSAAIGKRFKMNLLRFSFGHEYISEEGNTISNDWTGQIRLNHFFKQNSVFLFIQGQNVISLKMNYRYLLGAGYRHRFLDKSKSYLDFSAGGFLENELYLKGTNEETRIKNFRYSFSSFSNIQFSEKIHLNTSLYYQLNSENIKDYRLYFEPRLYFELNKINLYFTLRYRYHSSPYIYVLKTDIENVMGVELSL